jgi:hypothetical protein
MLDATALEAGVIADPGKKTFPDNQGAYTSLELFQLGVFWMDILSDSCQVIMYVFRAMWIFSMVSMSDLPDPKIAIRMFSKLQDDEQQLVKLNLVGWLYESHMG